MFILKLTILLIIAYTIYITEIKNNAFMETKIPLMISLCTYYYRLKVMCY